MVGRRIKLNNLLSYKSNFSISILLRSDHA